MIDKYKLKEALPIFLKLRELDDSTLSKAIEECGYAKETAERIAAFLPSAFCCVALRHHFDIRFPESFTIQGSKKEFFYKEEPIYKLGIELASEIYHHQPELSEVFNSIVARSAECNAINKALNAGAEVSGSSLSPTNYFGYETLGKKRGILSKLFS